MIMNKKMKNTITDLNGRRTKIKDGETYTVIYCTIGLPYDLMVLSGLYHNADDDKFIGRHNNDGYCPSDMKIYFDNNVPDEVIGGDNMKIIRRVYTDEEFLNCLDKRFYIVEEFEKKLNELVD